MCFVRSAHARFQRKAGPPGQLEEEALLGVREAAELQHTPDQQELRPWTTDRDVQGVWNLVWAAAALSLELRPRASPVAERWVDLDATGQ